ncbi:MAG: alpha/beta hydrolase [Acidobacteria bacterium]|nr:alpha/beta hydrolase [Acidobacteriota bacterium]
MYTAVALLAFATPALLLAADPDGWKVSRDLAYVSYGAERQTLDLYVPSGAGPFPLVIWIHGGAWKTGSKADPRALRLLAGERYAIASLNYRLSHQAKFPAQIEDCKAAVRWLRANAAKYSLDPARFAAWGASAGGHLAALLGTAGDKFDLGEHTGKSSRVQAVVDYFGPTDFLRMDAHALPSAPFKHNAIDSPESLLVGGPLLENDLVAARANPATYASKDDPPFLIVHGDQDPLVPLDQSKVLESALGKAGVPVSLYVVAGAGHGQGFEKDPKIVPMVKEFLGRALRPR